MSTETITSLVAEMRERAFVHGERGIATDIVKWADRLEALEARVRELEADLLKLQGFAAELINYDDAECIGSFDGGDLQEYAIKYGLLIDTEVAEPCGEGCNCAGYGEQFPLTCYRYSDVIKRAREATKNVKFEETERKVVAWRWRLNDPLGKGPTTSAWFDGDGPTPEALHNFRRQVEAIGVEYAYGL